MALHKHSRSEKNKILRELGTQRKMEGKRKVRGAKRRPVPGQTSAGGFRTPGNALLGSVALRNQATDQKSIGQTSAGGFRTPGNALLGSAVLRNQATDQKSIGQRAVDVLPSRGRPAPLGQSVASQMMLNQFAGLPFGGGGTPSVPRALAPIPYDSPVRPRPSPIPTTAFADPAGAAYQAGPPPPGGYTPSFGGPNVHPAFAAREASMRAAYPYGVQGTPPPRY